MTIDNTTIDKLAKLSSLNIEDDKKIPSPIPPKLPWAILPVIEVALLITIKLPIIPIAMLRNIEAKKELLIKSHTNYPLKNL